MTDFILSQPASARRQLDAVSRFLDDLTEQLPRAVTGDSKALTRVASLSFALSRTVIGFENSLAEAALAATPPAHPQHPLTRTQVAVNHAFEPILGMFEAAIRGDAVNAREVAREVLASTAEARAANNQVMSASRAMMAELGLPDPDDDSAVARQLTAGMATYEDSVRIENRILVVLEDIAKQLQSGADIASLETTFQQLDPLVRERIRIGRERQMAFQR